MYRISVIITIYNQPFESIVQTLNSLVHQDFKSFEVVVADDCSKVSQESAIKNYFSKAGFSDYRIVANKENVGTVRNIIGALMVSSGEYIKINGAGDLLYAPDTLSKIDEFCRKSQTNFAFGKIKTFSNVGDEITIQSFNAPSNPQLFIGDQSRDDILTRMLMKDDWIPGGAIFAKREYLTGYLSTLADDYHVRYCEDLVSPLVVFDGRIDYLDEYVLWYEWGVGISNDGTSSAKKKMYKDHSNFFSALIQTWINNGLPKKAYRRFKIKRFVVLGTPLGGLLGRYRTSRYLNPVKTQSGNSQNEQDFLLANLFSADQDYIR